MATVNTDLLSQARKMFSAALATTSDEWQAAQKVWRALRPKHLRAPYWDEAVALNTGRRRSFRCPLGDLLGLTEGTFGQYCCEWPRTNESEHAAGDARRFVLAALR